jgi:hypothetical protein
MESMRKIFGMNVLRTSAFALACLAPAGTDVKAAMTAMPQQVVAQTYSTGGTVLGSGISSPDGSTPTNAITYTPIVTGAFTSPSAVSLGEFQVATLPTGKETDYNNTPFTITYNPVTIAGANYPATTTPITITGTLNGSVTGSQSSVVAKFNSVSQPIFPSPDGTFISTLSILNNPLALVPASAGGITTVQAQVNTTFPSPSGDNNTPEPTTLAILATSIVGFGLRQRLRARKSA